MYGVIDIGSNTVRLVIYRVEGRELKSILNQKCAAGLVGYVGRKGRLSRAGVETLVAILAEYRAVAEAVGLEGLFPFATASLRNIGNTQEVLAAVRARCGMEVRVLSGTEEAMFGYYGAIRTAERASGLLVDVGGGSTELVFYRDGAVLTAQSLPVGSLNLYNRRVAGILPKKKELAQIARDVRALLDTVAVPGKSVVADPVCAVGGTARAVQKLACALAGAPADRYEAAFLSALPALRAADEKHFAAQLLRFAPDRVHTLLPGAAVLRAVAARYGCRTVVTSPCGVREGYLRQELEQRGILPAER